MPRFLSTILFVFLLSGSGLPARTPRQATGILGAEQVDTLAGSSVVIPASIRHIGNVVTVYWEPVLNRHATTGRFLTGYRIFSGSEPEHMILVELTNQSWRTFRIDCPESFLYFRVEAFFNGRPTSIPPHRIMRNGSVILDFEEGEVELEPYSENEDIDGDDWGITDEEALPGSERSLMLSGNTWKRLPFQRVDVTDTTVWSIGILSVDGDTMANMQAFGIGDGSHELFYLFHGMESIWAEEWYVSNQEARPRGQWNIYNLAVGYDWTIRYGYQPSIDELYFINDNDENDPSARVYFDQILDVTGTLFPEPDVKIRWRHQQNVEGPGEAVSFRCDVPNRADDALEFLWEFGDDCQSSQQNPLHIYRREGIFTAAVTVKDDAGKTGGARTIIETGRVRNIEKVSLCLTGDIMLARRYQENGGLIQRFGPEYVFEPIQPAISAADITIVNLECPLTDEGIRHPTKGIALRGWVTNIAGLAYAGVDIATIANNHIIDYGERGLEETMEILDAADILHTGAGLNEYQALQPVFKTVNGIRVGVLAYCNRTGRDYNDRPFMDAGFDRYGYAYFSADNILRSVPGAGELCDFLVVTAHGGWEYDVAPMAFEPGGGEFPGVDEIALFSANIDSATRELEHLAIDLGADMVIGHHPHVLQGFEVYRGAVIAHSMGNFVFDQNFWETWPSAYVWAELNREGADNVIIKPVFVDRYRPTPAFGALGRKILDRIAGYSYDLNAMVVPDYNTMTAHVVLDPRQLSRRETVHAASGNMRYFEDEDVYRSEPIRLIDGGFVSRIISIEPDAQDAGWEVSMGRDILLIGNMEPEGATAWNYNSNSERRADDIVHGGSFSSYLTRQQNQQDAITDILQRIPVDAEQDRLTLSGWLRTINSRDAGLTARYYRFRYDDRPQNILGTEAVERRLQGDNDWTYLWGQLEIPEETAFLNVRWQLFGPFQGVGQIWADDVELHKWENFEPFEGDLGIDIPNDLYYLQVQTRRPVESVTVTYQTITLSY